MTPHEMPAVLEYLQASFARRLGDAEVAVWAEELAPWPQEAALDAVRALRRVEERLPSHAAFRAAARAALPPAERDDERAALPPAFALDPDGFAVPIPDDLDDRLALPPAPAATRRAEIERGRLLLAGALDRARARAEVLRRRPDEEDLERPERAAGGPPPPFCGLEDHSRCGGPPVVSTKAPAGRPGR